MSISRNEDSKSDSKWLEDFKIETRFEGENTIEIPRRGKGSGEIVWKWEAKLGYATQTNVWLEKSPKAGSLRVVKAIEKVVDDTGTADGPLKDAARQVDYRRELKALALLCEHEVCFVKFFGFFENPTAPPWCRNNIFLATEYFPLGDLYRVLCAPDSQPSTEEDARYIASQLLYCLQIMHGLGITHRDLKPQNVFVVQRHPFWWLKLGDFGVSKAVADGLRTRVGTRTYMAPELIDANIGKYTSAVDMWSLGCVVYWVLTKAIPFPSFGVTSTSDFIKDEKKFPIEALQEKNVSEDGIQFLQKLIVANPSSRLSASKALEHTWLRKLQKWGCELEQKARQRDIPEVWKEDIVIAVIGATGVGKSSFINNLVPGTVLVGGGLQSVTQTIDLYECKYKGQKIILVDTPGFDDTARSDSEVLHDLAMWLSKAYERKVFLTGLIYMHPINQMRIRGSTSRIWRLARQLCGDSMSGFVLCTTMWNTMELDMAAKRESSLLDFPELTLFTRSSSPAFRYGGQREEAELVIDYLVSHGRPEVLAIQKEMFQNGLPLKHTGAGKVLWQDLDRQQARYRKDMDVLRTEIETARRERDYALAESLDQERSSHYNRHQKLELSMVQLQVDSEALSKEFDERRAKEWKKLLEVLRRTEARLVQEQADKIAEAEAFGQGVSKTIGGLPGKTKEYAQDLKSMRSSFTQSSCKLM